jgi:hypothetical protein
LYKKAAEKFAPGKTVRAGLFWLRNSSLEWLSGNLADDDLANLAAACAENIGHGDPTDNILL